VRVPSTNGVILSVHHLGGDGEPLLICHATGFCGHAYESLAAALADRFAVWAIDFRGHGDSTAPDNSDFAWTGMADDVLSVVDALGVPSLVGFGHSMGGAALLLAELARPGLLRAVYLYEPVVVPSVLDRVPGTENPLSIRSRRRRQSFASKAEALRRYASRPPLGLLRADALAAYVEHGFIEQPDGSVRLKCDPDNEARTFQAAGGLTLDQVGELKVPALVAVGGRAAEPGPGDYAPAVAATMPLARLVQYPHLGHFGPLQDPETVAVDVVAACGWAGSAGSGGSQGRQMSESKETPVVSELPE
jgi:pimeloyl-ACP methyl ester carboxylesterase